MGQIILRYEGKEEVYERDDEEIKRIVVILNPLKKYKDRYEVDRVENVLKEIEEGEG